jgi:hypothetical protein
MDALKSQIMAFRLIQSNRPLPDALKQEVLAPTDTSAPSIPQHIVDALMNEVEVEQGGKTKDVLNPYDLMNQVIGSTDHAARGQRMLVPASMPVGIDPVKLGQERERVSIIN